MCAGEHRLAERIRVVRLIEPTFIQHRIPWHQGLPLSLRDSIGPCSGLGFGNDQDVVDLHPLEGQVLPLRSHRGVWSCLTVLGLASLDSMKMVNAKSIQLRQDFKGYCVGHNIGGDLAELGHLRNTGKITATGWRVFSWEDTAAAAFLTSCSAAKDLAGSFAQPVSGLMRRYSGEDQGLETPQQKVHAFRKDNPPTCSLVTTILLEPQRRHKFGVEPDAPGHY